MCHSRTGKASPQRDLRPQELPVRGRMPRRGQTAPCRGRPGTSPARKRGSPAPGGSPCSTGLLLQRSPVPASRGPGPSGPGADPDAPAGPRLADARRGRRFAVGADPVSDGADGGPDALRLCLAGSLHGAMSRPLLRRIAMPGTGASAPAAAPSGAPPWHSPGAGPLIRLCADQEVVPQVPGRVRWSGRRHPDGSFPGAVPALA